MKKRIVHCLGQLNTGGAETLVMNILRKIDREKYQFDFLVFNDEPGFYDQEVKDYGCNIYYLPSMSKVGIKNYIYQMISFFKKEKIDVVHSHMDWQGGFIAYAAHKAGIKKRIVHSHAIQTMFETDFIHKCFISLNKVLIKKYATHCLACSKEAGLSLFGNTSFDVLPNGIDMDKYMNPNKDKIEELKHEFNLKETDIVLGHVGSFSDNKNQSFLIDVLNDLVKKNKNYKLVLVGGGSNKTKIEDKVKELNLESNVILTGVRKEIPEIMHLFDLFLLPSKLEGLGIVAIEAQACGLPCILSDNVPREVDLGMKSTTYVVLEKKAWISKIDISNKNSNLANINLQDCKFNILNTIDFLSNVY